MVNIFFRSVRAFFSKILSPCQGISCLFWLLPLKYLNLVISQTCLHIHSFCKHLLHIAAMDGEDFWDATAPSPSSLARAREQDEAAYQLMLSSARTQASNRKEKGLLENDAPFSKETLRFSHRPAPREVDPDVFFLERFWSNATTPPNFTGARKLSKLLDLPYVPGRLPLEKEVPSLLHNFSTYGLPLRFSMMVSFTPKSN